VRLERALTRAEGMFNAPVAALISSPRWGRLVSGYFVMVTYTGRRSGRIVTLPVAYERNGDDVIIGVNLPGAKTWWRNFTGDGGPVTVKVRGRERTGHAVARRDDKGRVTVTIRLDHL
jgi:F420H(2)-dependent quinone reductase